MNALLAKHLYRPDYDEEQIQPLFKRIINLSLVGLLTFVACAKLFWVSHPVMMAQYLNSQYPIAAVESIEELDLSGNLLNEYNWGGYLSWKLRDCRIFVDGRTDLYGDEVIGQWIDLINAKPGWEDSLRSHEIEVIVLSPDRPLVQELENAPNWQRAYLDDKAVVYRR